MGVVMGMMVYLGLYLAVVLVGVGLLYVTSLLRRRSTDLAVVAYLAVVSVFAHQHGQIASRLIIKGADGRLPMLYEYLAIFAVAIGSAAFIWGGLVRCWPLGNAGLGYPPNRKALALTALGVVVGLAASIPLALRFWRSPYLLFVDLSTLVLMLTAIPRALTEESVFRGRMLGYFLERKWRPWVSVLAQAAIYLAIYLASHVPVAAHGGAGTVSRGLLSRLIIGIVFGWLRIRTHNLWAPLAAHISYGVVGTLSVFTGVRPS